MVRVIRKDNENIEHLLKRYKKARAKAGVIESINRHKEFVSPTERRRRKHTTAIKRIRKAD